MTSAGIPTGPSIPDWTPPATVSARLASVESSIAVVKEGPLNVQWSEYGATGDGSTDDRSAIQTAINVLTATGGEIFLPPGVYLVGGSGLTLPTFNPTNVHEHVHIRGRGATLKSTTANTILGRALPADTTEAGQRLRTRFTVEGVRFLGSNTSGQKGLRLVASQGPVVRECEFINLDDGLEAIFCMELEVANCFGNANTSRTFKVMSGNGLWTGATVANSPSNVTRIRGCRDYCSSGQLASYYIEGSDQVRLENCVSEGFNPVRAVDFVHSSSARLFEIDGFWSENIPTSEIIRAPALNRVSVRGLHIGTGATVLVNAEGSTAGAEIRVEDLPFFPTATAKFRHGTSAANHRWVFNDIGTGSDMAVSTFWDTSNPGSGAGVAASLVDQRSYSSSLMGDRYPVVKASRYGIDSPDFRIAGFQQFTEITAPAAGAANTARLFSRDNGAGKTQLCVQFPTGVVQVLATEP